MPPFGRLKVSSKGPAHTSSVSPDLSTCGLRRTPSSDKDRCRNQLRLPCGRTRDRRNRPGGTSFPPLPWWELFRQATHSSPSCGRLRCRLLAEGLDGLSGAHDVVSSADQ